MVIHNGYVLSVLNAELTTEIQYVLDSKPQAADGYDYRLRADTFEWELHELPPVSEEAATNDDYESALGRFGV